jgi:hypothetical protein
MKATTTTTITIAITITIKEHIINFTKGKYYFHINDLKKYLSEKGIDFKEDTLKKTLYRLKKDGSFYDAGRGWYSTIKEIFELDTKPINEITTLIRTKFPLLEFSCWSTEQIKTFFHHLPSKFVNYVYADEDFLSSLKDFLVEANYNVYSNPLKGEISKYVEFKEKTIILRPSISYREPKKQVAAEIEKILVDLFMEVKDMDLMDMEEYKKILFNIIAYYHINVAMMLDYAHNRKVKDRIEHLITEVLSPPRRHKGSMSH